MNAAQDTGRGETMRIAIVGCGPMGLYSLKRLVAADRPLSIILLDRSDDPGAGMPYSEQTTSRDMLCNAFSKEIPSLTRPFVDWLNSLDADELSEWNLTPDDVNARAFFSRMLLGGYLRAELAALIEKGRAAGHVIELRSGHLVLDIESIEDRARLSGTCGADAFDIDVDRVIIATGHRWPETPSIDGVTIMSPWPARELERLAPGRIGVIGSSLSAIDVALTIGGAHGEFEEAADSARWFPKDSATDLRICLLSTKGVMPEADFHYPFPYEALTHLSPHAVDQEIAKGGDGLLRRVFALLLRDLKDADPDYLPDFSVDLGLEGFADAYFARRQTIGGIRAVRETFREARDAMIAKEVIPHRYVFLRADAVFDRILRVLSDAEYWEFQNTLLPVFADAYAAVPHRSVARLLAMHQAGVLELRATGNDAVYLRTDLGVTTAEIDGETLDFDVMIDARGQQPAGLDDLPFPTLIQSLGTHHLSGPYRLTCAEGARLPVWCLALPQVLQRHPFAQGLANCAELAAVAADDILSDTAEMPAFDARAA